MSGSQLRFSRDYDLPAAIVWDALVDEVLVEGWLAVARIDARLGGKYWLSSQIDSALVTTRGVITRLEPLRRLVIETQAEAEAEIGTDTHGILSFTLTDLPGGTRGTATELVVDITLDAEPRVLAHTRATWQSNLDQLESLLRGHPVDWSSWQRDRGAAWAEYLRASSLAE